MRSLWGGAVWGKASRVFFWLGPPLLCLAIYWHGLHVWFMEDDFVWLGLRNRVHGWSDLWGALLTPTVDGTLRPIGERAFFLAFHTVFGLNPLPARVWVFLTHFATLALIVSLIKRLTGRASAGFWAAVLWTSNSALATVMTWTTSYMHLLCGFLMLLAFRFFLSYIETGRRAYQLAQWGPFLLSFGVLETSVVYPALAAAYALLCARKQLRTTLPLFFASAVFAVVHMLVAPKVSSGPYSIHIDWFLPHTLWVYWKWALIPTELDILFGVGRRVISIGVAVLTVALLAFTVSRTRKRDTLPLLFLAWFVILLLPVLPLKEHKIPYYLTLPTIPLAMLGGYGVACASETLGTWKAATAFVTAAYLAVSAPASFRLTQRKWQSSLRVKELVLGVAQARRLHPDKVILLSGIDNGLFWQSIFHRPFLWLGIPEVHLAPGSELQIQLRPGVTDISSFVLPAGPTAQGLAQGRILVYTLGPRGLHDITEDYQRSTTATFFKSEAPRRVEVVNSLHEYLLGPGWYHNEGTHRWTGRRAVLTLGAPPAAGHLRVVGYCAPAQLDQGPLELTIAVDGIGLTPVHIDSCQREFIFDFALPKELSGKSSVEIAVQASRTITVPGDNRELGLMFGTFEIK